MKTRAFTFIEIVFVLALIGILTTVVVMNIGGVIRSAREKAVIRSVDQLYEAAVAWAGVQVPVSYGGISIAQLKTGEFLREGFTGENNPFGGSYGVGEGNPATDRVIITVTAVPTISGDRLVTFYVEKAESATYAGGALTITF